MQLWFFFFYSFYMGCAQCSLLWFCIEISIMAMWKCSDFTYIQCTGTICCCCCCFVLCVASHFTVDFIHFLFLLFPPLEYNLFNRYSRYICIKGYYSYTMKGKKTKSKFSIQEYRNWINDIKEKEKNEHNKCIAAYTVN